MRLKKIGIHGFKSFPDKISIDFEGEIAAIVGPNGSGKSNVCDAIRWVFGEQSAKTLRGGKMEDIIFGGTEKRKAQQFAEVSLSISNEKGMLPVSFSEVEITRRYFRSGESEYFINQQPVRLKDVQELFMDTGLGREGYSIIGQGRIAEILSVRSEDRRLVFEEAAGITKYRSKKQEALRKLQKTEENLVRIEDIVLELALRVEPLKEQAEKAKEYLRLYDEGRALEISLWLLEIQDIGKNVEELKRKYEVAKNTLELNEGDANRLDSEIEQLYIEMRECDKVAEEARLKAKEYAAKVSDHSIKEAEKQGEIKTSEQAILRIELEIEEKKKQGISFDEEIALLEGKKTELKERAKTLESGLLSLEKTMEEVAKSLSQRGDELSFKISRQNEILSDLSDRKIALSSAETEKASSKAQLEKADEESGNARELTLQAEENIKTLEKELEENGEEIQSILNVLAGHEKIIALSKEKKDKQEEKLAQMEKELSGAQMRLKMLSDLERDYDGFGRAIKLVMSEKDHGRLPGIHAPVSRLLKVEDEYTLAIETALGAAASNIVVEREADAKGAIAFLKRTDSGRATFLPLETVKGTVLTGKDYKGNAATAADVISCADKYKGVFASLLGRVLIVDSLDEGTEIAKQNGYRLRVVTKDGQVINPGGALTGGSKAQGTGALSRANEMEGLKNKVNELSSRKTAELESLTRLKEAYEKGRAEIENARSRQTECQKEEAVLKARLENANQSFLDVKSKEEDLKALKANTLERGDALDKIIKDLREDILKLENENDGLSKQVDLLRGGKEEKEEDRNKLLEKLMELKLEIGACTKDIEGADAQIGQIEGQKLLSLKSNENKLSEIEEKRDQIRTLEAEVLGFRELKKELEALIDGTDEIIKNQVAIKMQKEQAISEAQKEQGLHRSRLMAIQKDFTKVESQLQEAQLLEDHIISKLWETYELSFAGAKQFQIEIPNVKEAKSRVSKIKSEIKALGDVYVGAIEEYKEVKERYEFIESQKTDLLKSKDMLLSIIDEVTDKMQKQFTEEFEKIRTAFSKTFIELFGGGRAELRLDDPLEPLTCGIEIDVQPPGKNVKALSLLSGGEQAFVAISIIFAILKVRPTPFCIFDEIEAALDDVNVTRFAEYIKSFKKETQFVLITHRRGTMEAADILYGVTMQERGVSKLLSINVSDVEKKLKIN